MKATYMTSDLFIFVNGKRDERDEAHCEPGPAGYTSPAPIAAVSTLTGNVLGAFELGRELCREDTLVKGFSK